eukprot:342579-Pelagomonas_calceolata.AAC.1
MHLQCATGASYQASPYTPASRSCVLALIKGCIAQFEAADAACRQWARQLALMHDTGQIMQVLPWGKRASLVVRTSARLWKRSQKVASRQRLPTWSMYPISPAYTYATLKLIPS